MHEENIHALPIGHAFEGYRIDSILGVGGFGITYGAEEIAIGRKVAIKEYLPSGFAARAHDTLTVRAVSETAKQRFLWGLERFHQEAATLVQFEHPNLVPVHRYFEAHGTAYLVMQYVEGEALDVVLARNRTLPEAEIEALLAPILDGLDLVHGAHVLHRDVKPANIVIRYDRRPILLDFGAARQALGRESRSLTALVSEGYAPFEQYEARGDQGPWTDIYAIGAVIYQCVTGEQPPPAPERVAARLAQRHDPMEPASVLGDGRYSSALLGACDRALGLLKEERPQSVAELRTLLGWSPGAATSAIAATAPAQAPVAPKRVIPPGTPASHNDTIIVGAMPDQISRRRKKRYRLDSVATAALIALAIGAPALAVIHRVATENGDRQQITAVDAARGIGSARAAISRGELVDGQDQLLRVRSALDTLLKQRPRDRELVGIKADLEVAEAEVEQGRTMRVRELLDGVETTIHDEGYVEAAELLEEAERLAPASNEVLAMRRRVADPPPAARSLHPAEIERLRASAGVADKADPREREVEAAIQIELARELLRSARAALEQSNLLDARRLAADGMGLAHKAARSQEQSGKALALETELGRVLDKVAVEVDDRVAAAVSDTRDLAKAGRWTEAGKRLDDAAELEPASASVIAARKDFDAAQRWIAEKRRRDLDSADGGQNLPPRAADVPRPAPIAGPSFDPRSSPPARPSFFQRLQLPWRN